MKDASIVTYANEAKMHYLGVSKDTLDTFGAVSECSDGLCAAHFEDFINTRNEANRLETTYSRGVKAMEAAITETGFKEAASVFESISDYKDSVSLAAECYEKAEIARKDSIYNSACSTIERGSASKYTFVNNSNRTVALEKAIKTFESLEGWRDSAEKIAVCKAEINEINARIEAVGRIYTVIFKNQVVFCIMLYYLLNSTVYSTAEKAALSNIVQIISRIQQLQGNTLSYSHVGSLFAIQIQQNEAPQREQVAKPTGESGGSDDGDTKKKPVVRSGEKVGRNDPCPCGSGKKYKKCCGQ